MIKLQFKLPQTLISRGFTRRTVYTVLSCIFYYIKENQIKRRYHQWNEKSKAAFDTQFSDYVKKDRAHGYPSMISLFTGY